MIKDSVLPTQGSWVSFPVGELRSSMPHNKGKVQSGPHTVPQARLLRAEDALRFFSSFRDWPFLYQVT